MRATREQIAQLTARLDELGRAAEEVCITRKTLLALLDPQPPAPPQRPDHPAYQQIHRLDQGLGRPVLEQDADGPGPESIQDVPVQVERRQHDDLAVRAGVHDAPCRLDTVGAEHTDVHEDDVRAQGDDMLDSGVAVGRLADYGDVRFALEDEAKAAGTRSPPSIRPGPACILCR